MMLPKYMTATVSGDVAHHGEVMGDKDIGEVGLLLEVQQKVHHLGLDGHVQGGDGLVADDELRVHGEGAGDADALALAAGELVGETVGVLLVEADDLQQIDNLLPSARRRRGGWTC